MLSVKTDLHTHTLASGHAYSTIEENIRSAAELGLEAVGVSDHFSVLFTESNGGISGFGNFINYKAIPREWHGVKFLHGVEVDIVDLDGNLYGQKERVNFPFVEGEPPTIEEFILRKLDYYIASIHVKEFTQGATIGQTTEMYCKALEQKKVLMIGHIGRAGIPFDMDEVLLTAKRLNKIIEINNASFDYPDAIVSKCRDVAIRCAELGVNIAVNSDAHCSYYVGRYDGALKMLEEIDFPQELIANRTYESIMPFIEMTK